MICYQDRSFCNPETCNGTCPSSRRWTPEREAAAKAWWATFKRDGPPAVAFGNYDVAAPAAEGASK